MVKYSLDKINIKIIQGTGLSLPESLINDKITLY